MQDKVMYSALTIEVSPDIFLELSNVRFGYDKLLRFGIGDTKPTPGYMPRSSSLECSKSFLNWEKKNLNKYGT